MNKLITYSLGKVTLLSLVVLSTGCSHINMHQIAYEALRQEDCRINQLDDFCTRNFANEFREYEVMRRNFLRSQEQSVWRANQDQTKIASNSL